MFSKLFADGAMNRLWKENFCFLNSNCIETEIFTEEKENVSSIFFLSIANEITNKKLCGDSEGYFPLVTNVLVAHLLFYTFIVPAVRLTFCLSKAFRFSLF